MTHKPEDQEGPFVTWSKGKKDSDKFVYWIGIFMLIVGVVSWVCEIFA